MIRSLLFIFSFCVIMFYLFIQGESVEHNQPTILGSQAKLDKNIAVPVLDAINANNSRIASFSANIRAIAQMPRKLPVRLNGFIKYQKPNKFRLELNSFFGPELRIGSNDSSFWFWAGRMNKPALYWSNYENFHKTRLKTPFNPKWLSHCLGLDVIDYENAVVDQSEKRWRIIKKAVNSSNEPITTVIYVDPNTGVVTGHGVYDIKNNIEASSEIKSFNGSPNKITFIWHKENSSIIWDISNVVFNTSFNEETWIMPNITPKIDMSRE